MSVKWKLIGANRKFKGAVHERRWRARTAGFGRGTSIGELRLLTNPSAMAFGDGVKIRPGGRLEALRNGCLSIGDRTEIEDFVHIGAADSVKIGSDCVIASMVTILDHDHGLPDGLAAVVHMPLNSSPVSIGRGVWVGEKATILKGVTIGAGAVIGAHAVVTKDVPPGGIAVGIPARTLRVRAIATDGKDSSAL